MQLEDMKVGKAIEIFVTRDGYRYRLVSTVEGTDLNRVYITLIATGARVFRFLESDRVELIYRDDTRMYKWTGVLPSVERLDGDQVHSFYSKKPGESFNRRSAFRLPVSEEIEFSRFVPVEEMPDQEMNRYLAVDLDYFGNDRQKIQVEKFQGILKDLSENGAGLTTDKQMEIGDDVGFILFAGEEEMYLKGNVIRHSKMRQGKYKEHYGLRFTRVDKKLRKFLFEQQRLMIKKEREKELR